MNWLPNIATWELFARPDYRLTFRYPAVTPHGRVVQRNEEHHADAGRVHLTSPGNDELYIEVSRFQNLAPDEEYRRHRAYLEHRDEAAVITALTATSLAGASAQTYRFRVGERERAVVLLPVGRDTYRIIDDPRSSLNAQVIATVAIVG